MKALDRQALAHPAVVLALGRVLLVALFLSVPADRWPLRLTPFHHSLLGAFTLLYALLVLLFTLYRSSKRLAGYVLLFDCILMLAWLFLTGGARSPLAPFLALLPLAAALLDDLVLLALVTALLACGFLVQAFWELPLASALDALAAPLPLLLLSALLGGVLAYRHLLQAHRLREAEEVLGTFQQQIREARRAYQHSATAQLADCPAFDLCAEVLPAALSYGGDYVFSKCLPDGSLALTLFDVCGKRSLGAALAPLLKYSLLAARALADDPREQLLLLENFLAEELPADQYVAALHLLFSPAEGTLRYFNLGMPPLLLRSGSQFRLLEPVHPPLGLGLELPPTQSVPFAPGDLLLCCSDGLYELACPGAEDPAAALLNLVGALPDEPEALLNALFAPRAKGPLKDDVTVVVVRLKP